MLPDILPSERCALFLFLAIASNGDKLS